MSNRGIGRYPGLFVTLLCLLFGRSAYSSPSDCVGDAPDGRAICFEQQASAWGFGFCWNEPPQNGPQNVYCRIGGGTVASNGDCLGFKGFSDETVVSASIAFTSTLDGQTCTVTGDTGWNAVYDAVAWCGGGAGQQFQEGHLVSDSRHITLSCHNLGGGFTDLRWSKGRSLACPFGSTPRTVVRNGTGITVCTVRLVEPPPLCCGIGNPVTAGDRIKVETMTDYRGAGGLVFTRYHHAFFPDPVTLTPDGHTQSQPGAAWHSNFDKRVIPVAPGINALTFPDGTIQYFDAQNAEIFNYSGARASLVTLPAGGYIYNGPDVVEAYRADGRLQSITQRSGDSLALTYSDGTSGLLVDAAGNATTEVLPANLLVQVTDSYGNALSFKYSGEGRLVVMTDPSGASTLYGYDTLTRATGDNLNSVTYPDGHAITYRYNEPTNVIPSNWAGAAKHQLTSIVDENGSLYGTFIYDANNRVLSTEHAGAQRYQFATPSSTATNITDPLGTLRTYSFQVVDGISRLSANSLQGGEGFGSGVKSKSYDAAGNLISMIDFNNHQTCYAYDTARNLETVRVEGLDSTVNCASVTGTGAALPAGSRKITTVWHPRWRLPVRVAEPLRIATYVYNGDASCAPASAVIPDGSPNGLPIGVLCMKTTQATSDATGGAGFGASVQGEPRTWSYTYNAHGKVLTTDGPRIDVADVTTYTYYAENDADLGKRGNLASVTNALGFRTQILAYNAHGQPLTIVDPNGLSTTLGYDPRQRLTSRDVGGETTIYSYDNVGQLTRVTLPDTSYLAYGYDPAHRLTSITDNLGNSITYTPDPMGNRIGEDVRDPGGSLAQTRSRVYDGLNRLFQDIGAQNQTTQYAYDNQGNLTSIDGPLSGAADVTVNGYDALNRLVRVTDPGNGVTQYGYDGLDQLSSVTDPRNLVTAYGYDGLANLNAQASPDTGNTINTYDAAGNLLTQTDAKGQVTRYAYDALNRVTSITFDDGSAQNYGYDQGSNGLGRLTYFAETNPQNQITILQDYAYDAHGRTITENRTLNGVTYTMRYGYDAAGRLSGLTYPSGRTVDYGFDALGRIGTVSTTAPGGGTQVVASNIAYQPFGGVKSWTLGNGQIYSRGYDTDGRISSYGTAAQSFSLGYDPAGRIFSITDSANSGNPSGYGYDSLDRLTSATTAGGSFGYSYDAVGNRLTKTTAAGTDTYTYSPTSNRLSSISGTSSRSFTFDANGSTLRDGVKQYTYDARGRMVQSVNEPGVVTAYQVNALGQRVRKTNPSDDRVFLYDTRGHLIAETTPSGALLREYLYLADIPIAVIQ